MIKITDTPVMWIFVDDATGICFPETMYSTEAYARQQAERILGKRRMAGGSMVAVRVALTPLTAEETAAHRKEYEDWRTKKDAKVVPLKAEGPAP